MSPAELSVFSFLPEASIMLIRDLLLVIMRRSPVVNVGLTETSVLWIVGVPVSGMTSSSYHMAPEALSA